MQEFSRSRVVAHAVVVVFLVRKGTAQKELTMSNTKTIVTNKYGRVDIRKTAKKLNVRIDGKEYERVAWEDSSACYWVKVNKRWRRVDKLALAAQRSLGMLYAWPEITTYGI